MIYIYFDLYKSVCQAVYSTYIYNMFVVHGTNSNTLSCPSVNLIPFVIRFTGGQLTVRAMVHVNGDAALSANHIQTSLLLSSPKSVPMSGLIKYGFNWHFNKYWLCVRLIGNSGCIRPQLYR